MWADMNEWAVSVYGGDGTYQSAAAFSFNILKRTENWYGGWRSIRGAALRAGRNWPSPTAEGRQAKYARQSVLSLDRV